MPTPLRDLPIGERLRLVEDLWDSIAEDQDALPIPDAHKRELDARLRAYELDGDVGTDATAAVQRIRASL